jgi:hypothetical protein
MTRDVFGAIEESLTAASFRDVLRRGPTNRFPHFQQNGGFRAFRVEIDRRPVT